MTAIAFLGIGLMGAPMARRLLDAGHQLAVWNRSPGRTEGLEAAGAQVAGTPAAAASQAELVITMLADPGALAEVTEGPDGVAAGIAPGATVAEMSTVGPAAVRRLRDALPDAVDLLDAPVLGSVPQAEAGALQIFVGGEADVVSRWSPVLDVLGSASHVGPLTSGAAAKLVVNSTLGGTLAVIGEALALADGLGLGPDATLAVLSLSPLAGQVERRRAVIEGHEPPLNFRLRLAGKDLELVEAAAGEAGTELRLAPAVRSWLDDAVAAGWGERDYSSLVAFLRRPG